MNNNSLANTPENEALNQELEKLKLEFTELYMHHKQMVENDSVLLTAAYLAKLGNLQLELLQRNTESSRLKMKIKLMQAAINRNEKPNVVAIEETLNARFQSFYEQIVAQAARLEEAQKILFSLLSEEEALKLKELFRVLCKRLHPDLHPAQSEAEKDLFIRVKAAYDLQRIDELQTILLLVENNLQTDLPSQSASDKEQRVAYLKNQIKALHEKTEQLEQSFPFNVRTLIGDEEQIRIKQEELKSQVQEVEAEIEKSRTIISLLLDE